MINIYIRPLKEEDAILLTEWRNTPSIWQYTGSRPQGDTTVENEIEWINKIAKRSQERRFAICIQKTDQYIGNVQLTDITDTNAQFHIFIGEQEYWNKGVATKATNLILEYGFLTLKLFSIYLFVKVENIAAIKSYIKNGFRVIEETEEMIKMEINAREYKSQFIENDL